MTTLQPKPQSMKYSDLIGQIEKGTIKIRQFQRDFVWDIAKTSELLDSILKGYPIGTFILWQTKERINNIKNIGTATLPDTPEGETIQYILDGQQRITSLFAAYRGLTVPVTGKKKGLDFTEVVVTLDASIDNNDEQIVIPKPPSGKYLLLRDVLHFSLSQYRQYSSELTDEEINTIESYRDAFKTYEFSTVNLQKNDIESAIEVFTRINTSGQNLTLFEIMSAKTYDEKQNFDMQQKWTDFVEEVEKKGFDLISSSVILNLLSIMISRTKECKRSVILSLDKQKIIDHWDQAIAALRDSIDYFRRIFRVPVSRLLPYDTLLVPFSYFFFKSGSTPSTRQRLYLEEFFWRLSLSHRYSGASDTALAQDIRRIDEILLENQPDYSEISVELREPADLIKTSFSASDSFCKAILCLLASFEPRDLLDDGKVILNNSALKVSNSRNYHHFFPQRYLEKLNFENSNSIVNITFISDHQNKNLIRARAPSEYMSDFKKENSNLSETIKTHLIDDYSEFGILGDDYETFLRMRSQRIYDELLNRMNSERDIIESTVKVEDLLASNESDKLEFKSTLRFDRRENLVSPDVQFSVIKTVAGFLNSEGGNLIIGVDDDGQVLGLDLDLQSFKNKPNIDGFQLHLVEILNNNFGSLVTTNMVISFPKVGDTVVCWIKVIQSNELTFVKSKGQECAFVRMGNSTKKLSPQEQSNYEKKRRDR